MFFNRFYPLVNVELCLLLNRCSTKKWSKTNFTINVVDNKTDVNTSKQAYTIVIRKRKGKTIVFGRKN
jgi:hypothetical protein